MFVIFLFSRDYLEKAIYLAEKKYPTLGHSFKEWLLTQRNNFQARKADATVCPPSLALHINLHVF